MKKIFSVTALFLSLIGTAQDPVSLNGTWKIDPRPNEGFWKNEVDPSSWQDVKVPGECLLQGIRIVQDAEFAYKRQIAVPAGYAGKLIRIRFDGVYSYARVWINGKFVRDHYGSFTTWYADITKFVKPGESAWLTVGVTDKKDDISRQSDYAHHLIGGILRNVTLEAVPFEHLEYFFADGGLDRKLQNGYIVAGAAMNFSKAKNASVVLRLFDAGGKELRLKPASLDMTAKSRIAADTLSVVRPEAWTAENPVLYTLLVDVWADDRLMYSFTKKIGFRRIDYSGNTMRINNMPVKLRGACRHDVHPLYGRSTTNELDELDVKLMKEANVNFVRTSHYPPSEHFLDLCDRYGIYVEEENAICFMHNHPDQKPLNTNDEPYVSRAVAQMGEMVFRDRSHPSVIIWSIGNESMYGTMFKKLFEFIKKTDGSRPAIFSYPYTAKKQGVKCYDILSLHYADYKGFMGEWDHWQPGSPTFGNDTIPELNDEYAHLACYNKFTLRSDPGIRDFWGESIDKFWTAMFNDTAGCLGGSIWAWSDDIFYLPDTAVGYGPWGPVDGWRRKKPEFWSLKKAYSPVKVVRYYKDSLNLNLTLANRYDHTTLARISIRYRYKDRDYTLRLPHTHPHKTNKYVVPYDQGADSQYFAFYLDSMLIDAYTIPLRQPDINLPLFKSGELSIQKTSQATRAGNARFTIEFDNATGKIISAASGKDLLITGGPYLNFGYKNFEQVWESHVPKNICPAIDESHWKLEKFSCTKKGNNVFIDAAGHYDSIAFAYNITINPEGQLFTNFSVNTVPAYASVIGLRYSIPSSADSVQWLRRGYWEHYPSDHIGRTAGTACKYYPVTETYRAAPDCNWKDESKDFFLNGVHNNDSIFSFASRDFVARKMNIYTYTVNFSQAANRLTVVSFGTHSAKIDLMKNGKYYLCVDNFCRYPDLGWGNYTGPAVPKTFQGENALVIHPRK